MKPSTFLTIITVTKNDRMGLERTYRSISPLPLWVNWIIVDGASTDGTVELVGQFTDHDSQINFISESDAGIYEAMNKALNLLDSDFCCFLNSGDEFLGDIFRSLQNLIDEDFDIHVFNHMSLDKDGGVAPSRPFPRNIATIKHWACYQHQSTIIRSKCFDLVGSYNTKYRILADYHHFSQCYMDERIKIKLYPRTTLTKFYHDGVSSDSSKAIRILAEYLSIQKSVFGKRSIRLIPVFMFKYLTSKVPGGQEIEFVVKKVLLRIIHIIKIN